MNCIKTAFLALALLAAGTTASADALADGNARLELNFLETSQGTFGFVRIEARYHLPLLGSVRIMSNGQVLKVGPIATSDQQLVTTFLGPNGKEYTFCAAFEGETYLGGDNSLPASTKACVFRSPRAPVTPVTPRGPRQPALLR